MKVEFKKGKWKISIKKNGLPYKWIWNQENGTITSFMEKPDFSVIPHSIHVSGAHIIPGSPKDNHYDHWHNGKEWKERDENSYFYRISGNTITF